MNSFASNLYEQALERVTNDFYRQPILSNLARPLLLERMIEVVLGENWKYVGANWSGWDIEHESKDYRIEIKQSSAWQTWSERPSLRGRLTKGSFDIRSRTGYFSDDGSKWIAEVGRHADAYVFAWHGITEKEKVDHRDITQWEFYLLPTERLPAENKTISLSKLRKLANPISYRELAPAIEGIRLQKTGVP
jgi:hypothetical protein